MKRSGLFFLITVFLGIALVFSGLNPQVSFARTMVLKVSHQFAAGDVRDKMARVFGDMVTKRTHGQIKFRKGAMKHQEKRT